MTKEDFLLRARESHGYKYNYPNLNDKILSNDDIDIEYNGIIYRQKVVKHILLGRCPEKNTPIKTTEQFISEAKLIWFDKSNLNDIYQLKEEIILLEEVPDFIKILLHYVRKMKFDETPDYSYIINIIIETFKNNLFENDDKFEWNLFN